jgi:hypothetical protein
LPEAAAADTAEKHTEAVQEGTAVVGEVEGAVDDVYKGVEDVAGILKKGIKFENSWMGSKYKNFLKGTTYDAFQQALLESLILQAKLDTGKISKDDFATYGTRMLEEGKGLYSAAETEGGGQKWADRKTAMDADWNKKHPPGKQLGGPIPDTGMYKLHQGEYVLPAAEAAAKRRGASGGGTGGGVVANITINGTNLSQQQLQGAVLQAMDSVARRQ